MAGRWEGGKREDKFIENVDKNGVCSKTLKMRVSDAFSHAVAVLFAADQFIDTVHFFGCCANPEKFNFYFLLYSGAK